MQNEHSAAHIFRRDDERVDGEKFWWTGEDRPGAQWEIHKNILLVDDSYQRSVSAAKVSRIAREWNFAKAGSLIVGQRGDGRLFVVDGQNRKLAADKLSRIQKLPCLVFASHGPSHEAEIFLGANTERKPMAMLEKFKALIVTGSKTALFVKDMVEKSGRHIGKNSGNNQGVQCAAALMIAAKKDKEALIRVWPLLCEMRDRAIIPQRLLEALHWLESRAVDECSLSQQPWRARLLKLGAGGCEDAMARAHAMYGKPGAKVGASGILIALNRGIRSSPFEAEGAHLL